MKILNKQNLLHARNGDYLKKGVRAVLESASQKRKKTKGQEIVTDLFGQGGLCTSFQL